MERVKFMSKKTKILIVILAIAILLALLCPVRSEQYDGVYYSAILYTVINKHEIIRDPESPTGSSLITGTQVFLLRNMVFDNTETIEYDLAAQYDHE